MGKADYTKRPPFFPFLTHDPSEKCGELALMLLALGVRRRKSVSTVYALSPFMCTCVCQIPPRVAVLTPARAKSSNNSSLHTRGGSFSHKCANLVQLFLLQWTP